MFANKIVLVTGGSSGIGEATAMLFAENGADVAITYKTNRDGADKVADAIRKLGRQALTVQANLINENEAKAVIDAVVKEFGRIDVLVNNAGRYIDGDEWNAASELWVRSLEQNLVSMMNVSKYAAMLFLQQKSGVMVNVATRHGVSGWVDAFSYSAAKAGVINIAQAYSKMLSASYGGRANTVSPGPVNTGYWLTCPKEELEEQLAARPNHKLVEPRTVAEKIMFLASDEAKNINGQNFPVEE